MSITPAFSPGPWITHGALVGRPLRWMREDLYEQCSFHIAEKIPSSVNVGTRPINFRMRSYSSGLRPCDATTSGVIWGSFEIMVPGARCKPLLRHIKRIGKEPFLRVFQQSAQTQRGPAARPIAQPSGTGFNGTDNSTESRSRGRSDQHRI